ncbi:N-acetylglucosamine kinase [Pseudonocardia sp. GCM10023141]|uniref:N-acetylglucosamine kinase n=1 Tax=Pseudonocardia sp. GCM10023141 TaxID=3252653 RepID=UPI003611BA7E
MDTFVGMDVGGSRSRAAVIDASGGLLGAAEGPGGNPTTHPPDRAFDAMARALGAALNGLPAAHVRAVVIGMAGGGSLGRPRMTEQLAGLAATLGLGCRPDVRGDVIVAFAAGTPDPSGTVLISGTGAVAARITGWTHAAGVDGHGWLLGDTGSGFWLGRRAVQAALAALDGRRVPTALLPAVTGELLGTPATGPVRPGSGTIERLVEAVHAAPPIALARLAPLVTAAASAGDAVALRIVDEAADALVSDVVAIREPGENTPIVLAGSVAGGANPVAALVRARLEERWPGCVATAGDAARAAAWLALAGPGTGSGARDPGLHRVVIG